MDDQAWLDPDTTEGTLQWTGGDQGGFTSTEVAFEFELEGGNLVGEFTIRSAPVSREEFRAVSIAGLALKPTALLAMAQGGSDYELHLEWANGATLVWANSVPSVEQVPVSVAIGGTMGARSRVFHTGETRVGLIGVRRQLELPLVLPQLVNEETVWVGASGCLWQSFPVAPKDREIRVALSPAAAVRVLYDPPAALGEQHVFVRALPTGNPETRPVDAFGMAEFNERPGAPHEVWIAETDDQQSAPASRIARTTLTVGETTTVDLTSEHTRQRMGGLRVLLHAMPETIAATEGKLKVHAMRRAPLGAELAWEYAGTLTRVDSPKLEGGVFEFAEAEPGPYRLHVAPLWTQVKAEVVAGETRDIEVDLDNFGWVQLSNSDEHAKDILATFLTTSEPDPRERSWLHVADGQDLKDGKRHPFAAGHYLARARCFPGAESPTLVSDEFEVRRGVTTQVSLRPQSTVTVTLVAQDLTRNESIALDRDFWSTVKAVSTLTGRDPVGWTSYSGTGNHFSSIRWDLPEFDGPISIEVPSHPLWEFEEVEPLRLEDGATITLRARLKQ